MYAVVLPTFESVVYAVVLPTFESVVYAVVLPGVLQEQHLEQQVEVRPQLVRVGVSDLPQQLAEHRRWEVWVLPATVLQLQDRCCGFKAESFCQDKQQNQVIYAEIDFFGPNDGIVLQIPCEDHAQWKQIFQISLSSPSQHNFYYINCWKKLQNVQSYKKIFVFCIYNCLFYFKICGRSFKLSFILIFLNSYPNPSDICPFVLEPTRSSLVVSSELLQSSSSFLT